MPDESKTTFSVKIGNTTFLVRIIPVETAEKPLESTFRDLCTHEILNDFFATGKLNLGET